jgi:hypothetical protein
MTYHPRHRWSSEGTLKSAGRGQEFVSVVGDDGAALDWLRQIFGELP